MGTHLHFHFLSRKQTNKQTKQCEQTYVLTEVTGATETCVEWRSFHNLPKKTKNLCDVASACDFDKLFWMVSTSYAFTVHAERDHKYAHD